jgi:hypothetical protein
MIPYGKQTIEKNDINAVVLYPESLTPIKFLRSGLNWRSLMVIIRLGLLSAEQRVSLEKQLRQSSGPHGRAYRAQARALHMDDHTRRGWPALPSREPNAARNDP